MMASGALSQTVSVAAGSTLALPDDSEWQFVIPGENGDTLANTFTVYETTASVTMRRDITNPVTHARYTICPGLSRANIVKREEDVAQADPDSVHDTVSP